MERKTWVWSALKDKLLVVNFEFPDAKELWEIGNSEVTNVPEEFLKQVDLTKPSIKRA